VTQTGAGPPLLRDRTFTFEQSQQGGELLLHKNVLLGNVEQRLTYGVEAVWTESEQMRDGAQTAAVLPDVFPVRDFPKTQTRQLAAYVQEEISFADGAWLIAPGVRVDSHRLDPPPDAIFVADNAGVATTGIDTGSVSPKLSIIFSLNERISVFTQYAPGFRAPPYNDVNIGFTNVAFGYTAISNPDLKPEASNG